MEYIEHETNLGAALNLPEFNRFEKLYGQKPTSSLNYLEDPLPRIGYITETQEDTFNVAAQPLLTLPMNELIRLAPSPLKESRLPQPTFSTLIDLVLHFHPRRPLQSSPPILAYERSLASSASDTGLFRIWCNDLRPALPTFYSMQACKSSTSSTGSLPMRPLLSGLDAWSREYKERVTTFLKAMREREDKSIKPGTLTDDQKLTGRMRDSWERGDFWIESFTFDALYWTRGIFRV
ncbi:hypothetical protein M430DRAFT_14389 [Amorphotheca resinae ATCC 22711]|uniref:Uncharacterized protein n=1 Tax=Amorphotheca resinae ATCC 22711 TaxID=857342 RepID=A0A2T3BCL8_AMORE|nr:hypothetical protein M430DRAFT_14389 [Amorphotheca resinae ATCC 22711]PSS27083.1 hypothetical protein M430DRAFT_14389 [Amorphotheca resinae ATCC 22711]